MKLTLRHASSQRGAEMGRRNWLPYHTAVPVKLRLTPLRWVDGAYDQWGAYWGMGDTIYCAWTETPAVCREHDFGHLAPDMTPHTVELFVRARSREEAKRSVLMILPKARFYR